MVQTGNRKKWMLVLSPNWLFFNWPVCPKHYLFLHVDHLVQIELILTNWNQDLDRDRSIVHGTDDGVLSALFGDYCLSRTIFPPNLRLRCSCGKDWRRFSLCSMCVLLCVRAVQLVRAQVWIVYCKKLFCTQWYWSPFANVLMQVQWILCRPVSPSYFTVRPFTQSTDKRLSSREHTTRGVLLECSDRS